MQHSSKNTSNQPPPPPSPPPFFLFIFANQLRRDKIDNYKDKLKTQQEDSEKKLSASRDVEAELRDRIRDLEDAKLQSSGSSTRG